MKNWKNKATAAGMCAVLGTCSTGAMLAQAEETQDTVKQETVYVLTDAQGAVQKTIVSDWIKNQSGNDTVEDYSELDNIKVVKGSETFTEEEDGNLSWNAQGNDIYYQGDTQQELPVEVTVTYQLDGEEISAEEIAGKSGKVTIRFAYENHQYMEKEIDGQKEKIYVPFAAVTGMLLDGDTFRNVEVENGVLVNDGDHMAVVGMAFPGLQDTLALSTETFTFPDYLEITADTEDFQLGMTLTLVSNAAWNHLDQDAFSSSDDLLAAIPELTDGVTQLLDGSAVLSDGLCTLLDKSTELAAGAEQLAAGSQSLQEGAAALDEGAEQLRAGCETLSNGLSTISANSASLAEGAEQVFQMLLTTAAEKLADAGITVPELSAGNYAEVLDSIIQTLGEELSAPIVSLKSSLDSYYAFYTGLLSYTEGVDAAAEGAAGAAAGAAQLKDGADQLKSGSEELNNGTQSMNAAMPALVDGITQLKDGAQSLSDGLHQFDEKAVQKLESLTEEDLEGITERLAATLEVSESYCNFSGIAEEMDGQVKFIYRTDEIAAEE